MKKNKNRINQFIFETATDKEDIGIIIIIISSSSGRRRII
jgi:hypothetical protein